MIRSFARGVLIGTACICLLALGWLFLFRPSLAQYEASELKEAFTESDPGGNSGVLSLPWFNAENEKQPIPQKQKRGKTYKTRLPMRTIAIRQNNSSL